MKQLLSNYPGLHLNEYGKISLANNYVNSLNNFALWNKAAYNGISRSNLSNYTVKDSEVVGIESYIKNNSSKNIGSSCGTPNNERVTLSNGESTELNSYDLYANKTLKGLVPPKIIFFS